MFAGCCQWRSLAVDGGSGTSPGHGSVCAGQVLGGTALSNDLPLFRPGISPVGRRPLRAVRAALLLPPRPPRLQHRQLPIGQVSTPLTGTVGARSSVKMVFLIVDSSPTGDLTLPGPGHQTVGNTGITNHFKYAQSSDRRWRTTRERRIIRLRKPMLQPWGGNDGAYQVGTGGCAFHSRPCRWKLQRRFRWRGNWPAGHAGRSVFWFGGSHRGTRTLPVDLLLQRAERHEPEPGADRQHRSDSPHPRVSW